MQSKKAASRRVTAITPQQRTPDRFNISLDGEFAFGLAADVLLAAGLRVGDTLTAGQIAQLTADDSAAKAYNDALRYLSFRPRSQAEIRTYLVRRDVDEATQDLILERLTRVGLVNDNDFATYWVENRQTFSPRGSRALSAELRQKGVGREAIAQAIEIAHDQESEEDTAYRAARPRAERLARQDAAIFRKKMSDFLLRRGFGYGATRVVVERLWSEVGQAGVSEDAEWGDDIPLDEPME